MTEDKMIGCHHQLNGHKFEQTLGGSEGQQSLACRSSHGCKKRDVTATEQHLPSTGGSPVCGRWLCLTPGTKNE